MKYINITKMFSDRQTQKIEDVLEEGKILSGTNQNIKKKMSLKKIRVLNFSNIAVHAGQYHSSDIAMHAGQYYSSRKAVPAGQYHSTDTLVDHKPI